MELKIRETKKYVDLDNSPIIQFSDTKAIILKYQEVYVKGIFSRRQVTISLLNRITKDKEWIYRTTIPIDSGDFEVLLNACREFARKINLLLE